MTGGRSRRGTRLTARLVPHKRLHVSRSAAIGAFICLHAAGCVDMRYQNTATVFDRPFRAADDPVWIIWLKTSYFYPVRDHATFSWLGRALCGDEAWNVNAAGGVDDGPFFVERNIPSVTPREAGAGAATDPPPRPPWTVTKRKESGRTSGFIGRDASGRTFLVKLDEPEYPELGTGAEVIGSRIAWLMGYRVPAVYLVTIDGTGEAAFDGRRAIASLFVPGKVVGGFKFDHYRMRREIRALRLVCAWLNDTDRSDNNTLVSIQDGRAVCYQIDFNSCLGSWNGRPKEPWRGWRHEWDVQCQLLAFFTIGLLPRLPTDTPVRSPAVGTYDLLAHAGAERWRSENASTAFDRCTDADGIWMARRMAAVSREQLEAIVAAANYSRPEDASAVLHMLLERRRRVLAAWGASTNRRHPPRTEPKM